MFKFTKMKNIGKQIHENRKKRKTQSIYSIETWQPSQDNSLSVLEVNTMQEESIMHYALYPLKPLQFTSPSHGYSQNLHKVLLAKNKAEVSKTGKISCCSFSIMNETNIWYCLENFLQLHTWYHPFLDPPLLEPIT